jgi:hypothetical protein
VALTHGEPLYKQQRDEICGTEEIRQAGNGRSDYDTVVNDDVLR